MQRRRAPHGSAPQRFITPPDTLTGAGSSSPAAHGAQAAHTDSDSDSGSALDAPLAPRQQLQPGGTGSNGSAAGWKLSKQDIDLLRDSMLDLGHAMQPPTLHSSRPGPHSTAPPTQRPAGDGSNSSSSPPEEEIPEDLSNPSASPSIDGDASVRHAVRTRTRRPLSSVRPPGNQPPSPRGPQRAHAAASGTTAHPVRRRGAHSAHPASAPLASNSAASAAAASAAAATGAGVMGSTTPRAARSGGARVISAPLPSPPQKVSGAGAAAAAAGPAACNPSDRSLLQLGSRKADVHAQLGPQHQQRAGGAAAASAPVVDPTNSAAIMEALAARAESLDPRRASVLQHILATLQQAKAEGLDLSAMFADILTDHTTPRASLVGEAGGHALGSAGGGGGAHKLTAAVSSKGKGSVRLPRGLEPDGVGVRPGMRVGKNELVLRILGAYDGSAGIAGLTGLALFDKNGNQIPISRDQLSVRGGPSADVWRLIDGRNNTTSEAHMWTAPLPASAAPGPSGASGSPCGAGRTSSPTQHLELVISLPRTLPHPPALLKVWNYNKANQEVQVGVKWLAVFHAGRMLWHGVLQQGAGNATHEYATHIPLVDRTEAPAAGAAGKGKGDVQGTAGGSSAGVHRRHSDIVSGGELHAHSTSSAVLTSPTKHSFHHRAASAAERGPHGPSQPAAAAHPPHADAAAAPGLAAQLSNADLLAELQRRGIVALPPGGGGPGAARARVGGAAAAVHLSADGVAATAAAAAAAAAAARRSSAGFAVTETPREVSGAALGHLQGEASCAATLTPAQAVTVPSASPRDTAGAAADLVQSANSQVEQMPQVSVVLEAPSISPRLHAASSAMAGPAAASGVLHSDDASLKDAIKRVAESAAAVAVAVGPGLGGTLPGEARLRTTSVPAPAPAVAVQLEARASSVWAVPDGGPSVQRPQGSGETMQSGGSSQEVPMLRTLSNMFDEGAPRGHLPPGVSMGSAQLSSTSTVAGAEDDLLGEFAPRKVTKPPISGRRRGVSGAAPPQAASSGSGSGSAAPPPPLHLRRPPAAGADLNQSLDSLTFFQRHNRGRLTDRSTVEVSAAVAAASASASAAGAVVPPSYPPLQDLSPAAAPDFALPDMCDQMQTHREASVHLPQDTQDATSALDRLGSMSTTAVPTIEKNPSLSSTPAAETWSPVHPPGMFFLERIAEAAESADGLSSEALSAAFDATWPNPSFRLPLRPSGRHLEFRLLSTWGDRHYIGLSAVEVFDAAGALVTLSDRSAAVTAEPHSVNVLPESGNDPRVPENLFDGVNCTCSDLHQWLTPYTPGRCHFVRVDLGRTVSLGMVRLWNYNKSRIHSQRGVRHLEIWLEGTCVFQGEVRCAPGAVQDAAAHAECVVFTEDEAALSAMEAHDARYEQPREERWSESGVLPAETVVVPQIEVETGNGAMRPPTAARPPQPPPAALPLTTCVTCRHLTIEVLATWGDEHYVGMTALKLIDATGAPLALQHKQLEADPPDLNSIPGHSGDPRTLDKLLDMARLTTDDLHMWLAPTCAEADAPMNVISMDLQAPVAVSALEVWNYNKDLEGTARGVCVLRVLADGALVTPREGVMVGKAPGVAVADFHCTVPLPLQLPTGLGGGRVSPALLAAMPEPAAAHQAITAALDRGTQAGAAAQQDCLTPVLPCGFVLKLVIWSSWGDPFYVGLCGLEVHDAAVGRVAIGPNRISAMPYASVADLPNMADDIRTPQKLVNGDTSGDGAQSWLAPRAIVKGAQTSEPNTIVAVLPHAVALSKLYVWNYCKNPERGAQKVDVYLDDQLIYFGCLAKADPGPAANGADLQCLLFTNDPAEVRKEAGNVRQVSEDCGRGELSLVDERKVRSKGDTMRNKPRLTNERPRTAVMS